MQATFGYLKLKAQSFFYRLTHEEKGGAELVATLVIIGIILFLAFIFRDQISELVGKLWNNLVAGKNASATQSDVAGEWNSASSR